MRLVSLTLRNFRSYLETTRIDFDDLTAIIGRNDIGKSTILEALEIFFNQSTVKIDQNDPCVHGQDSIVEISCAFSDLPELITLDVNSATSLKDEWLLNEVGRLEIVKRFDCRPKTPKQEIFARTMHPSDAELADLLRLRNAELKQRARDVGADLAQVDERSNVALRRAIRATVPNAAVQTTLLPLNEDDGKKVWDQISKFLPIFALFQSDRPSRDDDPEVADPMKVAVAAAVREVEADLDAIKERVRASVMDVAQRTLAKLQEMDPGLANELTPSFKSEPKWDGFKLSLSGDDQIPINKRGSGVRRLILLNFFRAEAERGRALSSSGQVIYAIEEPESSQHPNNQVLLIKTLMSLAAEPGTQVILTTHVPAVAALIPASSVRLISRSPHGRPSVGAGSPDVYELACDTLGVLPDKRARVAIYVEGPNDVAFLTWASKILREEDPTLIDLEGDHRIAFVPTGGGNLKHWVNKKYLRNAGLREVHIYDADNQGSPKYKNDIDEVNRRQNQDIGFLTRRREMENYIHPRSILSEFGFEVEVTDWCDVPQLVAEGVHRGAENGRPWADVPPEDRARKESAAKKRLNDKAMSSMSLALLKESDPDQEIMSWLKAIRDRAN